VSCLLVPRDASIIARLCMVHVAAEHDMPQERVMPYNLVMELCLVLSQSHGGPD
jgi:hypothetical protein